MLARISLGRVGHSLPTKELLAFQLAHARARDAVWRELGCTSYVHGFNVKSLARNRGEYLRRPDLGRRLSDPSILQRGLQRGDYDAVIILADGLSAAAVDRQAGPVLDALLPLLEGWKLAPMVVAEQARVAIADEIGELLNAKLSVILIGERPGLSSPDTLRAYLPSSPRVTSDDP